MTMFDPNLVESGQQSTDDRVIRPGVPVSPSRLLRELRRNATVIAASCVAAGIVGAVVARVAIPQKYKSAATVMRDASAQTFSDPSRNHTSVAEDIKLDHNLAEVRKRLSLTTTLHALGERLVVEGGKDSGLTTIVATAGDPEGAAQLAEITAAVFLDARRELERSRAREKLGGVATDLEAAHRSLAAAQEAYAVFRREHDITDPAADRASSIEIAARLRAEADLAGVDSAGEAEKEKALRKVERRTAGMMIVGERGSNPAVARSREAESDLATLRGRLSPDHPRVLAAQSQVDALRVEAARPPSTVETVLGLSPDWDATRRGLAVAQAQRASSKKKQEVLSELAAIARVRAEQLSALDGRASELFAQVKTSDARLAELTAERLVLEAATRNPAPGFHLAAPATRPDHAERSLRMPIALASPLFGLLLAVTLVVLRMLRGLRVISPAEAAFWSGAPVVGATAWPRANDGLDELADDLSHLVSPDVGSVLVVAAGSAEESAARPLAAALGAVLTHLGRATSVSAFAPSAGVSLRRASRDAGCVLLVLESGEHSISAVRQLKTSLGRTAGIGVVVVSLDPEGSPASDRVGDVQRFVAGARV